MTVKFYTYVNFCVTALSVCTFAAPAIAEGVFLCGRHTDAVSRPSDTSAFALVSPLINFGCLINTQKGSVQVGAVSPGCCWRAQAQNDIRGGTCRRRDGVPGPGLGHAPGLPRPLISRLLVSFDLL